MNETDDEAWPAEQGPPASGRGHALDPADGAPWRDVPKDYGPRSTVANRFYPWWRAGILERVFAALLAVRDARNALDWLPHYLHRTVVRAHQHAAGARKRGHSPGRPSAGEALGRSRGGLTTKLHVRAEGGGKPVAFVVSPGQRHECRYAEAFLDPRRGQAARTRPRPERVAVDKGYSYPHVGGTLHQCGIGAVVPTRKDQRRNPHLDRAAYRTRERVERLSNSPRQV